MALLNIDGSDDPSYRYKMPKLLAKTEGSGNGIKTNILNISDVATALSRPSSALIKFFGVELGAQSKFDVELGKGTVNGAHQQADLQALTFTFIAKFVQCPECKLPETQLTVKKSGQVHHKCSACGHKGPVIDGAHRLNTFIVKEAEASAKSKKGKKGDKKDKKDKKDKSEKKEKKEKKDKKEKKAKKAAAAAASGGAASGGATSGAAAPHDVDLSDDGVEDAGSDAEDVVATADALVVDDLAAITAAGEALSGYIADAPTALSTGDIVSKVMELSTNAALPPAERVAVYASAVLGDTVLTQSADAEVGAALVGVMESTGSAKLFAQQQLTLLGSLDRLLGGQTATKPWLLPATPLVLLNLYKAGALWEDALTTWAAATGGEEHAAVVAAAAPMLQWLASAEVEEVKVEVEPPAVPAVTA